jgi:hypothetical protein
MHGMNVPQDQVKDDQDPPDTLLTDEDNGTRLINATKSASTGYITL